MMTPLQQIQLQQHSCCLKKVLFLLYLLSLLLMNTTFISAAAHSQHHQTSRLLLASKDDIDSDVPTSITKKIKPPTSTSTNTTPKFSSKNQTKLIKPTQTPSKNQTKLIKPTQTPSKNQTKLLKTSQASSKNQTKLINLSPSSSKNQTKLTKPTPSDPAKNKTKSYNSTPKSQIKKLNSTSNSTTKGSKPISPKNSSDLPKLSSPKNKTTKETKPQFKNSPPKSKSKSPIKTQVRPEFKFSNQITNQDDEEDDDDPISGFRNLPYKFHETIVPDLERISKTSRIYLTNYNHEITKGVKPYVGNKYAPTVAPIASFAFIIIPLILVSLIFNRITAYFSLQKILIFIQFYLALYFAILALSALVTGIEPLKFFYTASPSIYVVVQALQSLCYVLYLLLLLMYLIAAFSSETGLGPKLLGLAQSLVGFAIGLHYYVNVFHNAVLHQPPKGGWKVNGVYATCFLVISLLGTAGRRKKAYVEEGGEEGKNN